jgi:hypothetical protein
MQIMKLLSIQIYSDLFYFIRNHKSFRNGLSFSILLDVL